MKRIAIVFLKVVICLIGIVVLYILIRFPQAEGRAANLDLISIYKDPVIIYLYIASIPFFVGLYQAFQLLGDIQKNKTFTGRSVRALRTIKYCAIAGIGFIILAEAFLILGVDGDDKAGPIALGIYTTFASLVVAMACGVFQKTLQNMVE